MLNEESRKYFTRAYLSSGSASYWKVQHFNHTRQLQQCLEVNATGKELIEFMKTANYTTLFKCNYLTWIVFYERPNATNAFMTKTPDEIYSSDNPPVMDTMFSIASQVCIKIDKKIASVFLFLPKIIFIVTGSITNESALN